MAECFWAGTQQHVRSFTQPKRRESWSSYMTLGHAWLRDNYARQLDPCDGHPSDFDSFVDSLFDLGAHNRIIDRSLWSTTTLDSIASSAMKPSKDL